MATTNAPLAPQTSPRGRLDCPEPYLRHLHLLRSPNPHLRHLHLHLHRDPATPHPPSVCSPNECEGIADPPPPSLSPPRVGGDVAASPPPPPPPPPLHANASWESWHHHQLPRTNTKWHHHLHHLHHLHCPLRSTQTTTPGPPSAGPSPT